MQSNPKAALPLCACDEFIHSSVKSPASSAELRPRTLTWYSSNQSEPKRLPGLPLRELCVPATDA